MTDYVRGEFREIAGYPKAVQHLSLIGDGDKDVDAYEREFVEWVDGMGQTPFQGDATGISPFGVYVPTRLRQPHWSVSNLCERRIVPRRPQDGSLDAGLFDGHDPAKPVKYHLRPQTFGLRVPRDMHMTAKREHTAPGHIQFPVAGISTAHGIHNPLIEGMDRSYIKWLNSRIMIGSGEGEPEGILPIVRSVTKSESESFATIRKLSGSDLSRSALFLPSGEWAEMEKWSDTPISVRPGWNGSEIHIGPDYGDLEGKVLRGFFDGYCIIEDVGMTLRCQLDSDPHADFVHWIATVFVDGRVVFPEWFMTIKDE